MTFDEAFKCAIEYVSGNRQGKGCFYLDECVKKNKCFDGWNPMSCTVYEAFKTLEQAVELANAVKKIKEWK